MEKTKREEKNRMPAQAPPRIKNVLNLHFFLLHSDKRRKTGKIKRIFLKKQKPVVICRYIKQENQNIHAQEKGIQHAPFPPLLSVSSHREPLLPSIHPCNLVQCIHIYTGLINEIISSTRDDAVKHSHKFKMTKNQNVMPYTQFTSRTADTHQLSEQGDSRIACAY